MVQRWFQWFKSTWFSCRAPEFRLESAWQLTGIIHQTKINKFFIKKIEMWHMNDCIWVFGSGFKICKGQICAEMICDKGDLWGMSLDDGKIWMPNVLVTWTWWGVLYDCYDGLNNLLVFQVIKTHSVPANINYTNLVWFCGTTIFSGHSTHNYN